MRRPSYHRCIPRRRFNWCRFIYKAIGGITPSYFSQSFSKSKVCYALRSNDQLHVKIPRVRREKGKKGFGYNSTLSWNDLQSIRKLIVLTSLHEFKLLLTSCVLSFGELLMWSLICSYDVNLYMLCYLLLLSWPGHSCKRDFNLKFLNLVK